MARTLREVNAEQRQQLTKWAAAGATKQEIASRLGSSHDTLQRRFAEDPSLQVLFDEGHAQLKLSLQSHSWTLRAPVIEMPAPVVEPDGAILR